jgi:glycosyltransferase involved in cell wall biosynthesis
LDALEKEINNNKILVEVLVVDDGSSDSTKSLAEAHEIVDQVITYDRNRGRAHAVQQGILISTGTQVAVFDADFEYLPKDLFFILNSADNPKAAIYGSRYLNKENCRPGVWGKVGRLRNQNIGPWLANYAIRIWVAILFHKWYSEHFSGIRIYPGDFLRSYNWQSSGFEGDHEIASACHLLNIETLEHPISYVPRSTKDGKKIRAKDGFIALWVFVSWRFWGRSKLRNYAH